MGKSRLAKIVGVGLLSVFCLPAIAQAQDRLVKAGYQAVSKTVSKTGFIAACKEAGCPRISAAELAGKIEKAVAEGTKAAKASVEIGKTVQATGMSEVKGVTTASKAAQQAQEGVNGLRQPQAPKVKTPTTKYYSMSNNAEEIPTLVQQVETSFVPHEIETKYYKYTPGNSIGFHYQKELEYDIGQRFVKEVHQLGKKGSFSWIDFPKTFAEQEEYIAKFLENQKDDVKDLFANSRLDITTQARIAYTAQEWRKLTLRDLFVHPSNREVGLLDLLSSANKEVNIRMLFYLADTATRNWMYALQRTYGVDRTLQETVDWAATNHKLTLMQVEELLKSIDLRKEVIAQMNEMELPRLINQKAREIAQAAHAQREIAARSVAGLDIPLQQKGELEEVIIMGRLNAEQSEEMVEKALDAVKRGDSSWARLHRLWLLLRRNQNQDIFLFPENVLNGSDEIFGY